MALHLKIQAQSPMFVSGAAVQGKGTLPSCLILAFPTWGDVVIASTVLQNDLFHTYL
jgi:hypothetical protein